jgi:sigma-E factor negative regulatory protein RseA
MDTPPDLQRSTAEKLSALMDGELAPDQLDQVSQHWRSDPEARAQWHAYHVVGDVLRSEDLASTAQHDAQFLQSLRARLAQEPVVLAPGVHSDEPQESPHSKQRFRPAMAMVALLVAGVGVWTLRSPNVAVDPSPLAVEVQATVEPVPLAGSPGPALSSEATEVRVVRGEWGPVLRDAQLDHYLDAHQQFGGSSALGGPAGFVRNVGVQAPQR